MMKNLAPLTIPAVLENTLDELLSSSHDRWNQVWDKYVILNDRLHTPSDSPREPLCELTYLENSLITPPLDTFQPLTDPMDSFRPEFYEDFNSDVSDNTPSTMETDRNDKFKPPKMPDDAYFPVETPEGPKYQCAHPGCTKTYAFRGSNAKSHWMTHNNIMLYSCSSCGKRFTRRHDCIRHERVHKKSM